MTTLRRTLIGGTAAFALLATAACSSSDDETSESADGDATTESAPEEGGDDAESEAGSDDAAGSDESGSADSGSDSDSDDSAAGGAIEFEDNNGTHTLDAAPESIVVTDNRSFETLADWGIEPTAAAVSLMPDTVSFPNQDDIVDLGSHREPDLESVVVADPDIIINGQRFTQYAADFAELAPDALVTDLDPRDGEPFDEELIRQVTQLGEIFGHQDEAATLVEEFEAAVERVTAAYDPEQTVMAVNTSGGNIGYLAPTVGRTLGPVFDFAGLTPALEIDDASDDHQGDDISVEAIADSNPDWILVMDRDAAVGADEEGYTPAQEMLTSSEALAGVTAVEEEQIVYMPEDTYTNEGIQTYTEFLNDFADALEGAA
ncbi:siderophore ABC transporter substrate-binding protein [Georgenia sp. Z1344]|uniref:siderophore ABC transporter substrate-binding protein n=1 Tax=Georgenia sp. Z1344 TaxID=3416706 RepID=UPI003CE9482D